MSQAAGSGVRIGTVAGAPVRIGASWFVLAALVAVAYGPGIHAQRPDLGGWAYVVALGYAAFLLVSVLVHEGAHAWAARGFGHRVHVIAADLLGGHTSFDPSDLRPGPAAVIALAGPASNLVLGGIFWWASQGLPEASVARLLIGAAGVVNLLLGVFNALPGLPLDGGQAVEAGVWRLTGRRSTGTRVAAVCGLLVTAAILLWWVVLPVLNHQGIGLGVVWSVLIGMSMWRGAQQALVRARFTDRIDGRTVADVLLRVPVVPVQTPLAAVAEAVSRGGVVTELGRPVGLIDPTLLIAAGATPPPTTTVAAVTVRQPDGWVIEVSTGAPLLVLVQRLAVSRAPIAAIVSDGVVEGIVRAADVNALLSGR